MPPASRHDQPPRRAERQKQVVFVCQHGALRSRMAAAFFNARAPAGWSAVSAGLTPQTKPSTRIEPLLAGTGVEEFVDRSAPRSIAEAGRAERVIAIDVDMPGAETWATSYSSDVADEVVRDEIERRVDEVVKELAASGGKT